MKIDIQDEMCSSCVHFGYCLVYWGVKCKRQGGNKIPRMKSSLELSNKNKPPKLKNNKLKNRSVKIYEPIRTKAATW